MAGEECLELLKNCWFPQGLPFTFTSEMRPYLCSLRRRHERCSIFGCCVVFFTSYLRWWGDYCHWTRQCSEMCRTDRIAWGEMCLVYVDGKWQMILALFVVVNELTVQDDEEGSCCHVIMVRGSIFVECTGWFRATHEFVRIFFCGNRYHLTGQRRIRHRLGKWVAVLICWINCESRDCLLEHCRCVWKGRFLVTASEDAVVVVVR